jgi:hypothetical protein
LPEKIPKGEVKMYNDDMTDDNSRWMPDEGWHDVEVTKLEEGTSKTGNPKFTLSVVSTANYGDGMNQDLTNIPEKRWLLRQLLEACGIEPEVKEGRKIFNWDIPDVEGKTVSVNIIHDKTPFINREGKETIIPKPKIVGFKKVAIK